MAGMRCLFTCSAWLLLASALFGPLAVRGQDILITSFESSSFAPWTSIGSAFGSGPAAGAVDGQSAVAGFSGARFANSFHGGDASTGTLTSPPFTIQRDYIRFLIGGGNQRGKTCMNLVVDGAVVRTWAFPGDNQEGFALDDQHHAYVAQDTGGIMKYEWRRE